MRKNFLNVPIFRVLISLVLISGCAARGPSFQLHHQLLSEKTAVVVPNAPSIDLSPDLFARGKAMGALKGAGAGTLEVLTSLSGGGGGALDLLMGLVLAVGIGAPVGAVLGAISATPPEQADSMEQSVTQAVNNFTPSLDLGRNVAAKARTEGASSVEMFQLPTERPSDEDIRKFADLGFRLLIEVYLREIKFRESHRDRLPLALYLRSQVRVTELPSRQTRYEQSFEYSSQARTFSDWLAKGGTEMQRALSEGLDQLATNIVNGVFTSADIPIPSHYWAFPGTEHSGCCWICPKYPPIDYSVFDKALRYPLVNSLQPTLSWEEIPSQEDIRRIEQEIGQKPDSVYYEMRIWKEQDSKAGKLVYEKTSLSTPSHTVEVKLSPTTKYFWSVRSCFLIKGVKTCTPWAQSSMPNNMCPVDHITAHNYFRFMTFPKESRHRPRW